MALSTILEAIEDIKAGKFIIIVDDENRENEGDLAIAAEKITPDAINFMAQEKEVHAFFLKGKYININTKEDLKKAEQIVD